MANSAGYGSHPTIYGHLSDEELLSMYHEKTWFGLDESHRQQLLQETVNRSAAAKGELGSPEVRFADLKSSTLGQQGGGIIQLNRAVYAQDTYRHEYHGTVIEERAVDSNYRALETVLHEDIHAWQDQCTAGIIACSDPKLLEEYQANNFTTAVVPDGNGGVTLGSNYLSGETPGVLGYYLYYFQSSERDAHKFSEEQTMKIVAALQEKNGEDISSLTYQKRVLTEGYQATHDKAEALLGNPNFEQEINKVLVNEYYGKDLPVDPAIEAVVTNEMAMSYKAQNGYQADLQNDEQISSSEEVLSIPAQEENVVENVESIDLDNDVEDDYGVE